MYRLSLYFLLIPCLFLPREYAERIPEPKKVDVTTADDTCRMVKEYQHTHKILEGKVCDDKREGLWREWNSDGLLRDSAVYRNGIRVYESAKINRAKGTLVFRNNPRQFYKDSTYECCVRLNVYHGVRDIRGEYEGVPDTTYPPLFYFGADMGARDSFNYYFTPKSAGKYKLKLSLAGDAVSAGHAPFYEREVEVVKK